MEVWCNSCSQTTWHATCTFVTRTRFQPANLWSGYDWAQTLMHFNDAFHFGTQGVQFLSTAAKRLPGNEQLSVIVACPFVTKHALQKVRNFQESNPHVSVWLSPHQDLPLLASLPLAKNLQALGTHNQNRLQLRQPGQSLSNGLGMTVFQHKVRDGLSVPRSLELGHRLMLQKNPPMPGKQESCTNRQYVSYPKTNPPTRRENTSTAGFLRNHATKNESVSPDVAHDPAFAIDDCVIRVVA